MKEAAIFADRDLWNAVVQGGGKDNRLPEFEQVHQKWMPDQGAAGMKRNGIVLAAIFRRRHGGSRPCAVGTASGIA